MAKRAFQEKVKLFPILFKASQVGTHTGEGNNEPQLMNYNKLLLQYNLVLFVFTVFFFFSFESRTSN